jgi:hypothetical protein
MYPLGLVFLSGDLLWVADELVAPLHKTPENQLMEW